MIVEYSFDEQFKKDFKRLMKIDKSYELRELDGIGEQLDISEFSRRFFGKNKTTSDVSIDPNANVDKVTVVHYNNEIAKPLTKLNGYYLLWKYGRMLFNEEITFNMIKKFFTKEIYIHDAHSFHQPYCYNFSCMDIICQGIKFAGQTESSSPKHLSSFMGHLIAFITYACNQILGACGLADFLICASYFVEKLYEENPDISKEFLTNFIKQEIQGIVYQVNQPFRSSIQAPFTNVSVYDDVFLTKLCDEYSFPDGRKVKKETVIFLQKMYIDLMNSILEKTPITFPVTTACFAVNEKNEIIDKNFLNFIAEKNLQFGFMNIYAGKTSTLSSCCRLRSDRNHEYFNVLGSGSTKIGSLGVVTINLPRLAYESKNEEEFFKRIEEDVELASRINHIKRTLLGKRIEEDYLPLYSLGFMSLKHQYSTCGLIGINEAVEILNKNVLKEEGKVLIEKILEIVNIQNKKQEEKYKTPHNVEQIPGESCAIKLAQADQILGYNKHYIFYSNQFISLSKNVDIYDRIEIQGRFDKAMTGGAICHLNFIDRIKDKKFLVNLIFDTVKKGVVYHAINYNLLRCEKNHITVGKNKKCSICGSKIIGEYERIVGYLVNVKNWAEIRRTEDHPSRARYNENCIDTISGI